MRTTSVGVFKVATRGPGDVSGFMSLIAPARSIRHRSWRSSARPKAMAASTISPGNMPCAALCAALAPQLGLSPQEVEQRIAFVMSGGTEGVLSPHITVFTRRSLKRAGRHRRQAPEHRHGAHARFPPRRARPLRADQRDGQGGEGRDGGCRHRRSRRRPFRADQMPAAHQRARRSGEGARPQDGDTSAYSSMAYSRGASALGVAVALGEIATDIRDARRAAALRSVLEGRLDLGRDRADAQRRHRARQFDASSERIRDRACRDERCDRRRRR